MSHEPSSNHSSIRAVLLGPPGSGKGTQAKRLAERLGVPAISTGEMLRQAVAEGSELGRRVDSIMRCGGLVDDETMVEVVRARLSHDDAVAGFLLDGYPRTLAQAANLDSILGELEVELDAVLFIDVPESELVRRILARKRADDNEQTIRNRLDVYREKTSPLVGFYRQRGLLREIDGHQSIDHVASEIVRALGRNG